MPGGCSAIFCIWVAVLLAVVLPSAPAASVHGSRVLELSDRFLDVKHEGQWLVMFYAPWCGHCKRTEPIWLHVAQALANTNVRVGRADCSRFTAIGHHFNVNSYPTIMFLKGQQQHVYSGDRTTDALLSYARRMSGPPVQLVTRVESMETLRAAHDLFFVHVGKQSGPVWDIYHSVAATFQAHGFFYAAAEAVAGKHVQMEQTPCVAVCKANASYKFPMEDVDDIDKLNGTLTQWINEERFAHFPKITRANINQAMQTRKFLVLAVVEENKLGELVSHEHDFREMMENFTHRHYDRYHKRFQFGWVGSPELAHSIAMDHLLTPHLLVLNTTTAEHHLATNMTGNMTMEAVGEFLDNIHEEREPAYGGNSIPVRLYRMYFETFKSLTDMWRGNPVLTSVIFGLPLGFLSLICYSICCADIMDAADEDDDDPDAAHEKRE